MRGLGTLFIVAALFAGACSTTYGAEETPAPVPDADAGADAGGAGEDAAAGSDACVDCPAAIAPDGWSLVVVAASCPDGFTDVRDYVKNPRAPDNDVCACSCGAPASNGCTTGSATLAVRTGPSTCNDGSFSVNCDGACNAIPIAASMWNGASLAARAPVTVACAANAQRTALIDDGHVNVCRAVGAGALPPVGTLACVVRNGDEACPSGWPTRTVIVPPDGITDGRTCTSCQCEAPAAACTSPTLTLYTDAACATAGTAVSANGSCNAFTSGAFTHYRYTATSTATCVPKAVKAPVSGAVQLSARETMCCR